MAWEKAVAEIFKENSQHKWELPQCPCCSFYECCSQICNLRTPIKDNGEIVGYEDGCRHYKGNKE